MERRNLTFHPTQMLFLSLFFIPSNIIPPLFFVSCCSVNFVFGSPKHSTFGTHNRSSELKSSRTPTTVGALEYSLTHFGWRRGKCCLHSDPGAKTILHFYLTLVGTTTRQPSKFPGSAALLPLCPKALMEDSERGQPGLAGLHFT